MTNFYNANFRKRAKEQIGRLNDSGMYIMSAICDMQELISVDMKDEYRQQIEDYISDLREITESNAIDIKSLESSMHTGVMIDLCQRIANNGYVITVDMVNSAISEMEFGLTDEIYTLVKADKDKIKEECDYYLSTNFDGAVL